MFVDSADRTPHYSLRKLSVGVASVLLSTTLWMGANGSVAHADTVNDAQAEAPVAQNQQKAPQAQAEGQASTAEQATVQAPEKESDASTDTTKQEASDDLDGKNSDLSSLANRAEQDGLTVTKEDAKTYTIKQDALDDLDKQVADIQGKVTKYETDEAAYDAAKKVYDDDLKKWNAAQNDPQTVKGISQGLSFTNEHDASIDVTSGSDKPVKFIKSTAWLGKDDKGVYTDGMSDGGNISKSFSASDISYIQAEGTASDGENWGKTYTGVQLKVGESVVAGYTGLKNSVYIDNKGVVHKLSEAQVKYTLNETTAKDGTANIFLSNNPNIALWYGAAGDGVARDQSSGRVDLTVDLTFYDENGNPITLGQGSNAWLDMSSLNNGTTKVEYFAPDGNTTMQIPGSTIVEHGDGWYANKNNEVNPPAPKGWDNSDSADRYYGAAIMELEGNSFHIGQKITKYNPSLTDSRNVYCWFALDSSLATAYKPVEPTAPAKPNIVWHKVTYEPQKATVTYIDDTTKTTLKTQNLSGDSGADSGYNTAESIDDYKNKGYELVKDGTNGADVVFDHDSTKDQSYEVHLKHTYVTITPDDKNPVNPGDKINPNDPDPNSPVYGDEVKHDNLVKDAKQTIHYEGAGKDTPEDNVTTHKDAFTRTVTVDKVTGKSTVSSWNKDEDTFAPVTTPALKGYVADKKQAGGDKAATPDNPEVSDTVVYAPTIAVKPGDSWPSNAQTKVALTKDVTRTINYVDAQTGAKAADPKTQTVEFGRTAILNKNTGELLGYDTNGDGEADVPATDGDKAWSTTSTDKKWDKVASPDLSKDGYQPAVVPTDAKDADDANSVKEATPSYDSENVTVTVTYDKKQKATVTYIDDTTKTTLKTQNLSGDSGADSGYNTAESIDDYKNKGYELVKDGTNGADVVFDHDSTKDQSYEVHLKHTYVTITPDDKNPVNPGDKINPNDPDPNSPVYGDEVKHDNLVKDAKQTIHYEGAGKDTPEDNVTTHKDAFTRTVTVDKVTGKSTVSSWNKDEDTFVPVTTPVVKGHTADKKQAGGKTATPDNPEVSDTVVYTPNGSIVPVDPDGNPIPNTPSVPYETDPNDPTKVVDGKVPEVPSWTPKNGKPGDPVVPPTDPSKDTKVPYDHTKTPGTVKSEGKQTVTYVYKDKDGKVVKTKKVEEGTTFTGKTIKDEVTGKTTTTWDQKDHKYDAVTTPVEPGYTADKKSVGGETVTPDNPNRSYTVVYTPNGSIVPVDPNGNPIPGINPVPYETDPNDPTKVVDGKVPEVPSWTPKKGKPGDPVVPTDPTKDTEVPYDHTITPGETTVSGKQTVTYVYKDKDGKVVKTKTVEQDTTFTGKTTTDEVTGETTTTWDPKDHKYTEVTTPVEPGYTADKKSVGGETVTPDNPNRSYTVVYTPNGSIVPVDPNGNPIPGINPVPYETDPNDPTKVVDGKVPEVPSWTPKNGKPGDPVVPTDPSKDTKVPYDHTITPGKTTGKTTTTGKVEGLPEKPAKSAKAPAEKLVKTTVKAPKAVKTAEPAKTISIKESAQAQDQLPQTGEDNSKAAFGLGLASILGGIGILGAFKRKKKEN